tara:strand:- start:725 stop:1513 length:789 start_codon:yes stop_codon:yes gene_type:complete
MLIDSHCHLDFKDFENDLEDVLLRAKNIGVKGFLTIATQLNHIKKIERISNSYKNIWHSVGVHPHNASIEGNVIKSDIILHTKNPNVIGIGETGLDFYYNKSPKNIQIQSFKEHINASIETKIPLIIHAREAENEIIKLLKDAKKTGNITGVIHCFTGSKEFAAAVLDLGFYISLSGIVTFKNSEKLRNTVKKIVPLDRILIETDSPFLAPIPHRGKRNEPSFISNTAAFIANFLGIELIKFNTITTNNFFTLFDRAKREEL